MVVKKFHCMPGKWDESFIMWVLW